MILRGQAQFLTRLEIELATPRHAKSMPIGKAKIKKKPALRRA